MSAEQNPEIVHEPTMIEVFAGELEDDDLIRIPSAHCTPWRCGR